MVIHHTLQSVRHSHRYDLLVCHAHDHRYDPLALNYLVLSVHPQEKIHIAQY